MPTRPLRPPIAPLFTQFDENVISCRKTIGKAERDTFFLAAWLNGIDWGNGAYAEFRHDYWKDDPRVLFVPTTFNGRTLQQPGLPVDHPLSVRSYETWLKQRGYKQKT